LISNSNSNSNSRRWLVLKVHKPCNMFLLLSINRIPTFIFFFTSLRLIYSSNLQISDFVILISDTVHFSDFFFFLQSPGGWDFCMILGWNLPLRLKTFPKLDATDVSLLSASASKVRSSYPLAEFYLGCGWEFFSPSLLLLNKSVCLFS
jgi:hypothetical protein